MKSKIALKARTGNNLKWDVREICNKRVISNYEVSMRALASKTKLSINGSCILHTNTTYIKIPWHFHDQIIKINELLI